MRDFGRSPSRRARGRKRSDEHIRSLDRIYLALGARLGESLEREMISSESLAARRTPARRCAVAIAVMVYLGAVALIAAGVALIVTGWLSPVVVIVGVLSLSLGVWTCPRPYRRTVRDGVSPAAMPRLNAAVTDVAAALGVRPPDVVVFDLRFNASWGLDGWRRSRVLRLGIPLLAALDVRQTVALLAHELAHERNGDAQASISRAGLICRPRSPRRTARGDRATHARTARRRPRSPVLRPLGSARRRGGDGRDGGSARDRREEVAAPWDEVLPRDAVLV